MCLLCNCSSYSGPPWNKFEGSSAWKMCCFFSLDSSPLIDIWKWERNTTRGCSHNNRSWNCNKPKCSTNCGVNRRGTTKGLLVGWKKPAVERSHHGRLSQTRSAPSAEPGDDARPAKHHHLSFQHSLGTLSTCFGWVCILLHLLKRFRTKDACYLTSAFLQICPETGPLLPLMHSSFLQVQ